MSEHAAEDTQALGRKLAALVGGYQASAAIGAVARLGVADVLAGGPATAAELAARVGADTRSLERVLRFLTDFGVVEELDGGRFALGAVGGLLRSDVPGSQRSFAIISSEEWRWRAYGHLTEAVRGGVPGFREAHGCGFWEYLATHPGAAALVEEAFARTVMLRATGFAQGYDFGGVGLLVDVGGGEGSLMQAVLEAQPHLRGIVFDLPGVIERARARLAGTGLGKRCDLIAGDFLEWVPTGGDAYLLSWILHDWDDETATRILANCRAAMGDAGRVLAIELVLPPPDAPRPTGPPELGRLARLADLEMLAIVGGRERTEAEYRDLYVRAGLTLTRVVALESTPWRVLEGAPA